MAFAGPPRRPAGLVRYLLLAFLIISGLFYLRHNSATFTSVHQPIDVTPAHLPGIPAPQNPANPDIKPATAQPEPAKEAEK